MKVAEKDWHGVSDAANDLREMEAKYEKYILNAPTVRELEDILEGEPVLGTS